MKDLPAEVGGKIIASVQGFVVDRYRNLRNEIKANLAIIQLIDVYFELITVFTYLHPAMSPADLRSKV